MDKLYVNGELFEKSVVIAMTREAFIANYKTNISDLKKAEVYDRFTLEPSVFSANVKNGVYRTKTDTQILQEQIDALFIASLGGN